MDSSREYQDCLESTIGLTMDIKGQTRYGLLSRTWTIKIYIKPELHPKQLTIANFNSRSLDSMKELSLTNKHDFQLMTVAIHDCILPKGMPCKKKI